MSQEANDSVDAEGDGRISLELAHSLLNEITHAKNELNATQRELKETKRLYDKTQRELEQIPDLQCQMSVLQNQLKEKEKELQDTRAVLGQATVENQRLRQANVNVVAEPPNSTITQLKPSLKRARSPSLEIIEISGPFIRRNGKEIEVLDAPKSSIKPIQSTSEQSASSDNVLSKKTISRASGSEPKDNEQSPPELKRIKIEMMTRTESHAAETAREKTTLSEKAASRPSSSTTSQTQMFTRPQVASSTQQKENTSSSTTRTVPQPSSNQSTSVEKVPSILSSIAQKSTQPLLASMTRKAEIVSATSTPSVPTISGSETISTGKIPPGFSSSTSSSKQNLMQPIASASTNQTESISASAIQTVTRSSVLLKLNESSNSILPSSRTATTPLTAPTTSKANAKSNTKPAKALTLPDPTVKLYLNSCRTLTISPAPLDLEVPRAFIRILYGGSDMQFLQLSKENPSGPDQRRMVFPMLDLNPCVPRTPGEPGLIFASRHEILSNPPWTLFVKRKTAAPAIWLYLGEYECTLCGTMTAEQFRSQPPLVQRRWATLLLDMRVYDVYVSMRARIALRRAGRIPIDDKEIEKALVADEMQSVKVDQGLEVSEDDIVAAFCNGDEGIDIIRMNCVKYDHVFANHMKSKFPYYPALLAADKEKNAQKKAVKASSKAPTKSKGKSVSAQPVRSRASAEGRSAKAAPSTSNAQVASSGTHVPEGGQRRSSRRTSTRTIYTEDSSEDVDEVDDNYDYESSFSDT